MKTLSINEIGKTYNEISGGKIVFVSVHYDECAEDPTQEWDGIGKIYSMGRNHLHHISGEQAQDMLWPMVCPECGNSSRDGFYDPERKILGHKVLYCENCGKWSVESRLGADSDCVPLGYFEHGNCDWHVSGEIPRGTEGDYRWDGVRFAGVWEPDKYIVEQADAEGLERGSIERYRWMEKQARSACDTYTKWCNGWVYGYIVHIYKLRSRNGCELDELNDYRYDEPLYEDSLWGIYDTDYVEEEINSAIKYGRTMVEVSLF